MTTTLYVYSILFYAFLLVFSLGNVFLEMSLVEVEGNGNQELCEPDETTFKIRTSKVPQGCKCYVIEALTNVLQNYPIRLRCNVSNNNYLLVI